MKYFHPYSPYDIQTQFMDALFETLGSKKIGIFESPTGTGKTLSLICPSLAWLREREKREYTKELSDLDNSKGPQWSIDSAKAQLEEEFMEKGKLMQELATKARQRKPRKVVSLAGPTKKRKPTQQKAETEDFVLEDQILDDETAQLLAELDAEPEDLSALKTPTKIFFTSRTHSQLSQLVGALKLLNVPPAWGDNDKDPIRHISLGSRKQLCINPDVKALESPQKISDKCLDLQKGSTKCSYRKPKDAPEADEFRQAAIAEIRDIEELASLGEELDVCPYYAGRSLVPYAEVVTLPYQLLVQHSAREALEIDLKDSIIIIDEAHNLLDVVSSLFSAQISQSDVQGALKGLEIYSQRVGARLSPSNRRNVAQVIKVVQSLLEFFTAASKKPAKETIPGAKIPRSDLFKGTADLINLYDMQDFLQSSKLAFKVDSYLVQYLKKAGDDTSINSLSLGRIVDFLALAVDPLADGKLFFDRTDKGKLAAHYLLLDPSNQFKDIVEQARCVVLAGGTMEPTGDYLTHLFPYVDQSEIELFACGHVIPKTNFLVEAISTGPSNVEFEFTFAKRDDKRMVNELGQALLKIAETAPAGLVMFVPSYKYMDSLVSQWTQSGVYAKLQNAKPTFTENKARSADEILAEYGKAISKDPQKGALLFAVVGGKLSEGINFSDDLARGVVMVGLPFPNAFSAELIAKRDHIETAARSRGLSYEEAKKEARDYYENLSMRAVNQSVGRAIRHINDYAMVYLIDKRYRQPHVQAKLSGWVRDAVSSPATFGDAISSSHEFFGRIRSQ